MERPTEGAASQAEGRRLRISSGGVVTLPAWARAALGLEGQGGQVRIEVRGSELHLTPSSDGGAATNAVSKGGQLQLPADAHQALNQKRKGRLRVAVAKGQGLRLLAL